MNNSLFTAASLAAVLLFPFSLTSVESSAENLQLAQVEVIESSPTIRAIGQPRKDPTAAPAASSFDSGAAASVSGAVAASASSSGNAATMEGELYYQLQLLQQEVQALRGLVEEQAHQLQQLKQRQLDDYVDLDRRLSEVSRGGNATASAGGPSAGGASAAGSNLAAAGSSGASSGGAAPTEIPAGEFASYSAAVDLATKHQEFDRAIAALNEHLRKYPEGRYAPNSHYWLGQIYFVQGKMEEARQAFVRVVDGYPDHNKVSEARYKLGQVYFRLGDKAQAKALLEKVASGGSDSAPLAKNFLQQNYP